MSPVRVLEVTSTGQSGHHKSSSVSQLILTTLYPANYYYFALSIGFGPLNFIIDEPNQNYSTGATAQSTLIDYILSTETLSGLKSHVCSDTQKSILRPELGRLHKSER